MHRSQPRSRLEWVDSAKGLAILLVVIHHTVLILAQLDILAGPWLQINNAFQVFRMPVFFAAAGLFAMSAVTGPWKTLWSRRLSLYVWVFVVWTLIRFGYFLVFPIEARPDETDPWLLLLAPILPSTGLWFLHALFCFFVLAKVLNGWIDKRLQIVISAALSVVFLSYPGGNISWTGMGKYFFFFLAGCYLKDLLLRLVENTTWKRLTISGCLFGTGVAVISTFDLHTFGPFVFAVRVTAVSFGFFLSATLVNFSLGRLLGLMGTRSLEIYVIHVLVVSFICSNIAALGEFPNIVVFTLPLTVTAAAIAASLGIHAALTRVPGLTSVYQAPSWMKGASARSSA